MNVIFLQFIPKDTNENNYILPRIKLVFNGNHILLITIIGNNIKQNQTSTHQFL